MAVMRLTHILFSKSSFEAAHLYFLFKVKAKQIWFQFLNDLSAAPILEHSMSRRLLLRDFVVKLSFKYKTCLKIKSLK